MGLMLRLVVVGWLVLAGSARVGWGEAFDWGVWRVDVEEHWPYTTAGIDYDVFEPGVWLMPKGVSNPASFFMQGWLEAWPFPQMGWGLVGMIEAETDPADAVEVTAWGRRGNDIALRFTLRRGEGMLPALQQRWARSVMGLGKWDDPAVQVGPAVSVEEGRRLGITRKKVTFATWFPRDLPAGRYTIDVEVRNSEGRDVAAYQTTLDWPGEEGLEAWRASEFAELDDREMVAEFVRQGRVLEPGGTGPSDTGLGLAAAAMAYETPAHHAFRRAGDELARRGRARPGTVVPMLAALLEAEAVRNPGADRNANFPGWYAPCGRGSSPACWKNHGRRPGGAGTTCRRWSAGRRRWRSWRPNCLACGQNWSGWAFPETATRPH